MKAKLILENGMIFEGSAFGYEAEVMGEVVFNTSMNGYQEIMTDPASHGQILVMTYPLIGNYGINLDDSESKSTHIKALVVKEKCDFPNNFRCEFDLEDYLKSNNIMGLENIDTRALTKIIRKEGTMKGIILPEGSNENIQEIKQRLQVFTLDCPAAPIAAKSKLFGKGKIKVAALDFGITNSLLKSLTDKDCSVTVYRPSTSAKEILADKVDFVLISSGAEILQNLDSILDEIKILAAIKPTLGIGLGHELIALSFGGTLEKHLYGHRGSQPVKDLRTDKIHTTAQNHGYHVAVLPSDFEATHININDKSIEGMKHKTLPIQSVQFYPESPKDDIFCDGVIQSFLQLVAQEVQNA